MKNNENNRIKKIWKNWNVIILLGALFTILLLGNAIFFVPFYPNPKCFNVQISDTEIDIYESFEINWSNSQYADYYNIYLLNSNNEKYNSCMNPLVSNLYNNSYIFDMYLQPANYYFLVVALNDNGYYESEVLNISVNKMLFTSIPNGTWFNYHGSSIESGIVQQYMDIFITYYNLNSTHYLIEVLNYDIAPNGTIIESFDGYLFLNKSSLIISNSINDDDDSPFQNGTHAFFIAPSGLLLDDTFLAYNIFEGVDMNYTIYQESIDYGLSELNYVVKDCTNSFNSTLTFFDAGIQISTQTFDTSLTGVMLWFYQTLSVPPLSAYIFIELRLFNTNFNWNNYK